MRQFWPIAISGTILLGIYLFFDYLFLIFWILITIPFLISVIVFCFYFVKTIIYKNRQGIIFGTLIIGIILTIEISKSEFFNSKILLEASLIDDRAGIHLTLRKGNRFEVVSSTPLTDEKFTGTYRLVDDKIIFNDRPYDNEFIPDTVTIIEDKIILRFDKNGKPIASFADYFQIKVNKLKHINE